MNIFNPYRFIQLPVEYTSLTSTSAITTSSGAYEVWGDENYLYVATFGNGLRSISYDSNGNLASVDSEITATNLLSIWGDGNYLYAIANGTGMVTYSADASGNLTYIGTESTITSGWGIWGDGTYIYLAGGTSGLHTYSVDGAGNLTYIDSDDQGGNYYDVVGDGSYLYAACGGAGIRTYTQSSGILTYQEINTETTDVRVLDIGNDYLYSTDVTGKRSLVYSISVGGTLTRTYNELFSGSTTTPVGVLKLDNYVIFSGNDEVYLYEDNNDGTLTYKDIQVSGSSRDYRRIYGNGNLVFVSFYVGVLEAFKLI